jgi:hypothetical protein
MEQEKILMRQKQLQRWHLMKMVEVGKITLKEAGERIGVSYRQAKRIGRAIRERGMKGLVHGNRGRPSNHGIEKSLRKKVLELYGGKACAALDWQHPRDLFDIDMLFKNEGLPKKVRKAFIVYLASHSRPMIEIHPATSGWEL